MNCFSVSCFRLFLLVGLLAYPAHLAVGQDRARKSRSVDSFTKVEYAVPGTLHLRHGKARSVEVEAPQRVLDKVETTVNGSALEIELEGESGIFEGLFGDSDLDADEIDVYVTAPTLEGLTLAGSGRMVGETPVREKSLSLTVAGSGDMALDVETNDLTVRVAGSGACTLQGRASSMDVEVAGSGTLRAVDVKAQRAEVRIAGSGTAELHATDHLSAQIFGSGDVRYRGQPAVETTMAGSGDVGPIE
ncbi:MAG: head GIN domain-containing protein [Salinibacter sp.]